MIHEIHGKGDSLTYNQADRWEGTQSKGQIHGWMVKGYIMRCEVVMFNSR